MYVFACMRVCVCVFFVGLHASLSAAEYFPRFFSDGPLLDVVEMKGMLGTHLTL